MKRIRGFFFFLLVLCPLVLPFPAAAIEDMHVQARNAILVDGAHDEILYEQAANDRAYPASITKVMTALLVIEAIERGELTLEEMITCSVTSQEGLSIYGSTQDIQPGESLSVKDLLYCLMLASANEAGNILAEAVSGDVAAFVAEMNRRAGELGCENTHFTNTHGLHDTEHYTTAYDITLYFKKAMEYDLFRTIVSTAKYETAATHRKQPRLFYNTNPLISTWLYTNYVYKNCIGGKTGTTPESGGCLVSAAVNGDEYLIAVVLGGETMTLPDGTRNRLQYSESSRLFRWGFESFDRRTISPGDTPVASVAVTLSEQTDAVLVRPQGTITRTLPADMNLEDIQSDIRLFSNTVEAPVQAGQLMGTLTLFYEGTEYGTLDLVAVSDVERSQLLYRKQQVLEFFQNEGTKLMMGAGLLLAALVLLRLLVFRKRRRPVGAGAGRGRSGYGKGNRR